MVGTVRVVEVIRVVEVVKVVCRCWVNLEVKGPSPIGDACLCLTMPRRAGKNSLKDLLFSSLLCDSLT